MSCCPVLTRLLLSRVTTAPSTSLPPLTLSVSLWLANQRSVLRHGDQSQLSIVTWPPCSGSADCCRRGDLYPGDQPHDYAAAAPPGHCPPPKYFPIKEIFLDTKYFLAYCKAQWWTHLTLLPEQQHEHLPEQDVALGVGKVAAAAAPGHRRRDLPLAELDHVVLVRLARLQRPGEAAANRSSVL